MKKLLLLSVLLGSVTLAQDAGGIAAGTSVVTAEAKKVETTTTEPNADFKWVVETAKDIRNAVKNKDWGRLIFLIITVLVVVCRKFLAPRVAFLRGKLGAPILAFAWASAGALATTWPAGEKFDPTDLWLILQAGIVAMGGWSFVKAVLEHFYPKKEGDENWATAVAGFIGAWAKPEPVKP